VNPSVNNQEASFDRRPAFPQENNKEMAFVCQQQMAAAMQIERRGHVS
jgi:hypothetical protein